MPRHPDWLVPDWPAPAGVQALCTTRAGGVSGDPYHSLNLGDHVGDDVARVAANRERLRDSMAAHPVFLRQVHGTGVVNIDEDTPDGVEADGCVSASPAVACTIMVADCLPVLFASDDGAVVGAAHAGWRGLADGVLEAVAAGIADATGLPASRVLAWLGPCIGPGAFEVGPEVKAAFEAHDGQASRRFGKHAGGKWLADLPGLARDRLGTLGITGIYGNDGSTAWCTVSNPSRFFSHRRDRISGRFAACIWRS